MAKEQCKETEPVSKTLEYAYLTTGQHKNPHLSSKRPILLCTQYWCKYIFIMNCLAIDFRDSSKKGEREEEGVFMELSTVGEHSGGWGRGMSSSRPEVQREILSQNQNNKQKPGQAESFTHNLKTSRQPPSDDLVKRLSRVRSTGGASSWTWVLLTPTV